MGVPADCMVYLFPLSILHVSLWMSQLSMLCKCVSYFKWWVGVTWCHQAALCRCVSWLCYGGVSALCQVGVSGVLGVLGGEKNGGQKWGWE